jgi:NAD-dependent deacetylase sirtuin 4
VPKTTERLGRLAALIGGRRVLALSGAGISTESGIPDYRSPERLSNPRKPMLYQTFVADEAARRRYWARSLVGWQRVSGARPNEGHRALAALEERGTIAGVLTQNVDGLHQRAGSREVLELHGTLAAILCLGCRSVLQREQFQCELLELNPDVGESAAAIAPDGDADLPESVIERFVVPDCHDCGGVLKPHVVFFGENVPRERVERSLAMLGGAEVLLVVGSSLTVMSGLRFVLAARRSGKPVVIVNDGPTRADELAEFKVEGRLGDLLPGLAALLA